MHPTVFVLGLAGLLLAGSAQASCGSAFCPLNTSWDMQDAVRETGQWRADLRYEFIPQDRLWSGRSHISPAWVSEDTLERQTYNRNLVATLDYTVDAHWGVSLTLPWVNRGHSHIADYGTSNTPESTDFSELGDARIVGRYLFGDRPSEHSFGIEFGVRLPSGDDGQKTSTGVEAERSLQPGSGSTDVVAGAFWSYRPHGQSISVFAHASAQKSVSSRGGYQPGEQYSLNAGLRYALQPKFDLLLQLNALKRDRDSGYAAEPDLSGGKTLLLSPGASYAVTRSLQVYGFYQAPLYRQMNGVQLVANRSLVAGVSYRF